jgi:hypothetical protein
MPFSLFTDLPRERQDYRLLITVSDIRHCITPLLCDWLYITNISHDYIDTRHIDITLLSAITLLTYIHWLAIDIAIIVLIPFSLTLADIDIDSRHIIEYNIDISWQIAFHYD